MLLKSFEAHTVRTSLDLMKDQQQVDPGQDEQIQDGHIHDQDRKIQDQQQVGLTSHQEQEQRPNMLTQDDQVFVLEYFWANGTCVVKTLNQISHPHPNFQLGLLFKHVPEGGVIVKTATKSVIGPRAVFDH